MALEATHIKFALDIKDKLKAQDLHKYFSGAIYPDSRYITGIKRPQTHDLKFTRPEFYNNDDFRKGWCAHLLCDEQYHQILSNSFNDILENPDAIKYKNPDWITITAIKVLQDINDLKVFDVSQYIKYLDYVECPYNENPKSLKKYNQIIIDLYKTPSETTIESTYEMWLELGIDKEAGQKIKQKAHELQSNQKIISRINQMYNQLII